MNRPKGFTLIELLVVIAIIAILASILFPVFARVREQSRKAVCTSNLKQISQGFQLYLADWNQTYPCDGNPWLMAGRFWRWPLAPYLAQSLSADPGNPSDKSKSNKATGILFCPSDTSGDLFDRTSYCYSACFYHSPDQSKSMTTRQSIGVTQPIAQKEQAVLYPAQKILVGEWGSYHESPHTTWWDPPGGARLYALADGHVAYVRAEQIRPAEDGSIDANLTRGGIEGKDID